MWVEIVMLSNLAHQPAHGYELRQRVEQSLGTTLSNNSLYPTLRRFTEAGAVTRTPQAQQGRPTRHVYEVTPVGLEMLHDMLAELPDELAADQTEFSARLAQFDRLTVAERLVVLDARDRALLARAARLDELITTVAPDSWARVVLDEGLRRSHAELRWLETLRVRAASPLGGLT
ncbi:PadR-family transcriptional regulator [Kutzneria sp. 744]|nr:PadR-family transcriptional regulator [Kutzneria sp. 744]